jgi:hypothetical protein
VIDLRWYAVRLSEELASARTQDERLRLIEMALSDMRASGYLDGSKKGDDEAREARRLVGTLVASNGGCLYLNDVDFVADDSVLHIDDDPRNRRKVLRLVQGGARGPSAPIASG